jgi:hypothetical protein
MSEADDQLDTQLDDLRAEVAKINQHHLLQAQASWGRMVWYSIVRGMAFGFGSLIGATVIVYIVVSILSSMVSHVDFIPLVGDWVTKILEIVETSQSAD